MARKTKIKQNQKGKKSKKRMYNEMMQKKKNDFQ